MRYLLLLSIAVIGCAKSPSLINEDQQKSAVIYGKDTRLEVTGEENFSDLANATAILIEDSKLSFQDEKTTFRAMLLGKGYPLCSDEQFLEEPLVGFCSGVLIAKNKVLTAAHCLKNQTKSCDGVHVQFGWNKQKSLAPISSSEIYSCKSISDIDYSTYRGLDYAVLELDRDVIGLTPVKISERKTFKPNENVLSLSYPLGMPLKKDFGKILSDNTSNGPFKVEVDTFSGSSGSPLFDSKGELIGLLSSGAADILEDDIYEVQTRGGCLNFNRCKNGTCFGESFTKAALIPLKN